VELLGGGPVRVPAAPEVVIEVCRCGCVVSDSHAAQHAAASDWPLAQAWTWLTRPVDDGPAPTEEALDDVSIEAEVEADGADEDVDPASLPWWDPRSGSTRRRAVLPLMLLGELQTGVVLRAVYEVVHGPSGPMA
jgi:hypothetical protein